MKAKRCLVLMLAAVQLLFTGCATFGADVENHCRPPQATGEQGLVQAALADYMDTTFTQQNYMMKYPRSGDNRSAFLITDLTGDGVDEAITFYTLGTTIHINLLTQQNGKWRSVDDYESAGTEINSVSVGDVNGDGLQELFICWDMYSYRAYQMSMYSLAGSRVKESFTAGCMALTLADLTADGRDDCLLFNLGGDGLTAALWTMKNGEMQQLGDVTFGEQARQLRDTHTVKLSDEQNAVLLDYAVSGDFIDTALLYWEDGALRAPLAQSNLYLRPFTVPSGDVDKDGDMEWAACTLLSGFETAEETVTDSTHWLTTFYSWDVQTNGVKEKLSCIYNSADRYYLLVESSFAEKFTTSYDDETRTLWVYALIEASVPKEVFAVRTAVAGERDEVAGDKKFSTLSKGDTFTYEVWYDPLNEHAINTEALQYMLTLL